jgi:hypothetical protein
MLKSRSVILHVLVLASALRKVHLKHLCLPRAYSSPNPQSAVPCVALVGKTWWMLVQLCVINTLLPTLYYIAYEAASF